jgi:hypothetical protein
MYRLVRVLRYSGLGAVVSVGSQQVARSNAATAAALLLQRREEREAVDAFLSQRLDQRVGAGARSGTAS